MNNKNPSPPIKPTKIIQKSILKIQYGLTHKHLQADMYMQMIGTPDSLSNWQKNGNPVRLELQNGKELVANGTAK